MKRILNITLILFYFTFTNFFFLYADEIQDTDDTSNNLIEKTRIVNIVSSWIKQNKRFPTASDFKSDLSICGKYTDIVKKFNHGINGELKELLLDSDEESEISIFILKSSLSKEYWFKEDIGKREKLQNTFIKLVLLPWMDQNKRFFKQSDTNPDSNSYIGFSNPSIYTVYHDGSRFGFFENAIDLIKKVILITLDIDVEKNITLESKDSFKILKKSISEKKDTYIDWILKSKSFGKILAKDKSLFKIFLEYVLVKYVFSYMDTIIESNNRIPSDFLESLDIPSSVKKVLFPKGDLDFIQKVLDLTPEEKYIQCILEYLRTRLESKSYQSKILPEQFILAVIKADPERKYLKYLVKYTVLPDDLYSNDIIIDTFQEVIIRDFYFPYMSTYHEYPRLYKRHKNTIKYIKNKNFDLNYETVNKLFPIEDTPQTSTWGLRRKNIVSRIIELDPEERYIKYILTSDIREPLRNDPYIKEILRIAYIKYYLLPWIKVNKRFPKLNDFQKNTDKSSKTQDTTTLLELSKVLKKSPDAPGLFDNLKLLKIYYKVVKEQLEIYESSLVDDTTIDSSKVDDTIQKEDTSDTSTSNLEKQNLGNIPLNCIDLFSVIDVYFYK